LQPLEIPGDIEEARFLLYGEKVFRAVIENLFSPDSNAVTAATRNDIGRRAAAPPGRQDETLAKAMPDPMAGIGRRSS
jgi:hypothetical protein